MAISRRPSVIPASSPDNELAVEMCLANCAR
jgi:hypothetical protein